MSELGVIGQMYEDRRTKKKGKLVERDDKYKTLLMESEDGKSFNVSFSGFKSNWRSVDAVEPTIEEAMEEVEVPEDAIQVDVTPKQTKKKLDPEDKQVNEVFENTLLHMLEYAKSFGNPDIEIGADMVKHKKRIILRLCHKKVFNINYKTRKDEFEVCVDEKLFLKVKDKAYATEQKFHEKWIGTKYTFIVTTDTLDKFLEDAKQYVINYRAKEEE